MKVFKAHGLGNDYLVLERGPGLTAEVVKALCDRHRGPGGDGVLEPVQTDRADHGVKIWNPDGSVAEKSGNGLRIYAWWLHHVRGAPTRFTVDTGYDVVGCELFADRIGVEMGKVRIEPALVPVLADAPLIGGRLPDFGLPVVALSVGNPHCVVFVEGPVDDLPWREWGAQLERHPQFPNRTNVQFVRFAGVFPGGAVAEARIWERGAGETSASGSSSCAVAAACVLTGRAPYGQVEVVMPGGSLQVEVRTDGSVRLEGPVEAVGHVELDPGWVTSRTSPFWPRA